MSPKRKFYEGREQSYTKHLFLEKYLESAAYKIFQDKYNIFNFVDAFAGPWNTLDKKNYSDTSFFQALRILKNVRRILKRKDLTIRLCLCEKTSNAAQELRHFAEREEESKENFEIHVFEGLFEDNLDKIRNVLKGGFTFTFIDPTGWNISSEKIFNFLQSQRKGEFLINFMSEHINRHAEYEKVSESIGRFLADPNWKELFDKQPKELTNEERILNILKKKIKEAGIAQYLPYIEIEKSRERRIKMKLILGTNSPHGLRVFRDVQFKVKNEEMNLKRQRQFEEIIRIQRGIEGVGGKKYKSMSKEAIVKFLQEKPREFFDIANHLLELLPIRETQIKDVCVRLKKDGTITYALSPGKRKPQDKTKIKLVQNKP